MGKFRPKWENRYLIIPKSLKANWLRGQHKPKSGKIAKAARPWGSLYAE
jgi:hypothetical protein